jgi:Uma2 family endonuclease
MRDCGSLLAELEEGEVEKLVLAQRKPGRGQSLCRWNAEASSSGRSTAMARRGRASAKPELGRRGGASLRDMPTLVLDPQPAWVERLLEERRRSGADRRDEVWEGVLHVIPPPIVEHDRLAHSLHVVLDPHASAVNLVVVGTVGIGTEDNYRVPDLAVLRPGYAPQWNRTAALIVEIVSPRDDTWEKLPFYAGHRVDEVMIVAPGERRIHWLGLEADGEYSPLERSRLLGVSSTALSAQLIWT